MRVRNFFATAVAAALGVAALPAGAAGSVAITSVTVANGVASVSGTADLGALVTQSVGGTNTNFQNAAVADAAGISLTDAKIGPTPTGNGLRFTWVLNAMPAQVPPEGVRYTWSFGVGDKTFQLQAKRSNLGSLTVPDDPAGHVTGAANGTFQLRGNCTPNYQGQVPVANCPHLAFLSGAFNTAAKTVTMDLPFGHAAAPDVKRGATLVPVETATMSITAAFQAVVSNTAVSDYTNGWNAYRTGPVVELGIGDSESDPSAVEYTSAATLTDGSFTGTVEGLGDLGDTVYVRACQGADCVYASTTP